MGAALQVVHTFKQNATGTNPEALAAGSGDTLSVPNFEPGTRAWLLEAWAGNGAHACEFQIRSPFFHDNNRGIRMSYMFNPTLSGADGDPQFIFGEHVRQALYRTDTLIVETTCTAADNVALDYLMYVENLQGADMQLVSWQTIEAIIVNMVGIRVSVTAGATGDYGTAVALNNTDARLQANTNYAILGAQSQLPCGLLTFKGFETSSRRLGLPLFWNQRISWDFFVNLSKRFGIPCIPVVNANNAGNMLLEAADAATNVATAATINLAELPPTFNP